MADCLSEKAREAKREYNRMYRKKHREEINEKAREWRSRNKDKVKQYNTTYWERKALEI